MKTFKVMSRNAVKRYCYKQVPPGTIIISISDVSLTPLIFPKNSNVIDILKIQFDDVDRGELNCITKDDAEKIASFVKRHLDAKNIIVNCEAGVSRSAGCCAAIMYWLYRDDSQIFDNPRYCPNMTVYRAVLEALVGENDDWIFPEDEAQKKLDHNVEIWRKRVGLD